MLSTSAWAEEQKEENIVVSASRAHRSVAEMAQTTWVIERAEIEQQVQGGKEIKEVLAQLIPGMDVSSQGRTNYGMNLRGRSMMVMVDGVRLNSSRSDSRQLDSIDPFNIDRIEVISGATSLYGGGSTGGLVNIVTKKASLRPKSNSRPGLKAGSTATTTTMRTCRQRSAAATITRPVVCRCRISATAAGMTATATR